VGTSAPFNFNGLVRHYYLRRGPHLADIQVNLAKKGHRKKQSHAIAKRVRPALKKIADRYHARVKVAEVPPGPPVLSTLVAEIYGPNYDRQREIAAEVMKIFEKTPGVVDVDWYAEEEQPRYQITVDKEKAALNGISVAKIAGTIELALKGRQAGLLHQPREKEDVRPDCFINPGKKRMFRSLYACPFPPVPGFNAWKSLNLHRATVVWCPFLPW